MDDLEAAPVADTPYPQIARRPWARRRPAGRTVLMILGVVVLAALAAFALNQCASKTGAGRRGRPTTTVGVAKVVRGRMPIQLDELGTVTPLATVNVTSRIAGTLTRIAFKEGQMMREGALLAQVDPRPYQIALEQAQAQLARDQAGLANARLVLSRDETLLAENSIARQDVDTQRATVAQDEGVVKADQAAVDSARLNLGYTRITAPVAGRVGLRQIDVGNYISAGSATPVAVITEMNPIDVLFTIPEDEVQAVSDRMRSGATLPVQALDRSGGKVLGNGTLSTLDNQVDATTGTVKAKARFANPQGILFPNQFVNIRLLVNTLADVVVIPASAVRHGPQGDYVWVMHPDETAHMQPVKTGPGQGETISIAQGLTPGQTVITEGGDRLREGSSVQLPGQAPAGRSGGRGKGGQDGRRRGGGGG